MRKSNTMEKDKIMEIAVTLADAAEGSQSIASAFQLIASAFDDIANLLRESCVTKP